MSSLAVVVGAVIARQVWPGGGEAERASGPGREGPSGDGGGGERRGSGADLDEAPIEHVVFIVKENRTFNKYFATHPGAEGPTEGGRSSASRTGAATVP